MKYALIVATLLAAPLFATEPAAAPAVPFGPALPPPTTVPAGISMAPWQNQLLAELPVGESFDDPETGRVYTRLAWPMFAAYTETVTRSDYGKVASDPQFLFIDSSESIEIPAFDTSLGTLLVVGFLCSGEGDRTYEFENLDTVDEDSGCMTSGGCSGDHTYSQLALTVSALNCTGVTSVGAATISGSRFNFTLRQYDGVTDYAGLSGRTKTSNDFSAGNVDEYTDSCMLTNFSTADSGGNVRGGPFPFIVSLVGGRTYTNNDLNDADIDWVLDCEVKDIEIDVRYTY